MVCIWPRPTHRRTRRQGKIRGAGDKMLRDASRRAIKAFYPALSLCDLIFCGVFERHPRLPLARFKDGMLPSDFFRRNVVLSFQEHAIGIRLRDVIGVDNMMRARTIRTVS